MTSRKPKAQEGASAPAPVEEAQAAPAAVIAAEAVPADDAAGIPADQAAPPEPAEPAHYEITGPRKGRWRAGRFFTAEPTLVPVRDLTDDEIEALLHDPAIHIRLS